MNKIHLFPTFVVQDTYEKAKSFKELIFNTIQDHLTEDGYTLELTGHLTLQMDERYYDFYKFVTSAAMSYVSTLNIDPTIYDYNIVKSWFNITKKGNNPKHSHADAHLSFSYYVSTPIEYKKFICFFRNQSPNELYDGMLKNITAYNIDNASSWALDTNEGEIFVFPADLVHAVITSTNDVTETGIINSENTYDPIHDIREFRVVIAGDMVLTHKEKASVNMGLQPIKNWRTF